MSEQSDYVTFKVADHDDDGTPLPGERVEGGRYYDDETIATFLFRAVRAAGWNTFDGAVEDEAAALWAAVETLGFTFGDLTALAIIAAETLGQELLHE